MSEIKTVPNCIDTVINDWLRWPEMIQSDTLS